MASVPAADIKGEKRRGIEGCDEAHDMLGRIESAEPLLLI